MKCSQRDRLGFTWNRNFESNARHGQPHRSCPELWRQQPPPESAGGAAPSRRTSADSAPSAMRMPISCVRWVTAYASTPRGTIPTPARGSEASSESAPIGRRASRCCQFTAWYFAIDQVRHGRVTIDSTADRDPLASEQPCAAPAPVVADPTRCAPRRSCASERKRI